MAFDVLIFWNNQKIAFHFIPFILNNDKNYNFLNYAWMSAGYPYVGVKVDKLKNNQHSNKRKIMLSTEPT